MSASSPISRRCATVRGRSRRQRIYGVLALGWRGSRAPLELPPDGVPAGGGAGAAAAPMMQSIVALEFATTLVPDWHETRLPLHFVATGLAQGLAMVLFVAALLRWGLSARAAHRRSRPRPPWQARPRERPRGRVPLRLMRSPPLTCRTPSERTATRNRITGEYAGYFLAALVFSVVVPQLLWFGRRASAFLRGFCRRSVSLGVWFDRFSIVVGGVAARLPALIVARLCADARRDRPARRDGRPLRCPAPPVCPLRAGGVDVRNASRRARGPRMTAPRPRRDGGVRRAGGARRARSGRRRTAGYTRLDAFSPFPLRDVAQELGVRPARSTWIAVTTGFIGAPSNMRRNTGSTSSTIR